MTIILLSVILFLLVLYFGVATAIAGVIAMVSRSPLEKTPASRGLAYENVTFPSRNDGITLAGWHLPGGEKGTVIVTHGGKQNRADATIQLLDLCGDLVQEGFDVLTFDRRGCGESACSGRRSRARLEWDTGGAVDYIRRRKGSGEKIFLLGISLGAVAALLFASGEGGISAIVSDSCFARTETMARRVLARHNRLLTFFLRGALFMAKLLYSFQPVNVVDKVRTIECPVLFIHGDSDGSIPVSDARELHQASLHPGSELWLVPDAGHSLAYATSPGTYIRRVTAFFLAANRAA